jgi:hypothetical protein
MAVDNIARGIAAKALGKASEPKGNTNSYRVDNLTIATSAWVANTCDQANAQEKKDYPYMATITIAGKTIKSTDIAKVVFDYIDQVSGNFSTNCYTIDGGIVVEAKAKPKYDTAIDYVLITATVE